LPVEILNKPFAALKPSAHAGYQLTWYPALWVEILNKPFAALKPQ